MGGFSLSTPSHTILSLHNQAVPLLQHAQESFLKSRKVHLCAATRHSHMDLRMAAAQLPKLVYLLLLRVEPHKSSGIYTGPSRELDYIQWRMCLSFFLTRTHTRALHRVLISQRGERSESACGPLQGVTLAFQELCFIFRPVALNYCKSAAP